MDGPLFWSIRNVPVPFLKIIIGFITLHLRKGARVISILVASYELTGWKPLDFAD